MVARRRLVAAASAAAAVALCIVTPSDGFVGGHRGRYLNHVLSATSEELHRRPIGSRRRRPALPGMTAAPEGGDRSGTSVTGVDDSGGGGGIGTCHSGLLSRRSMMGAMAGLASLSTAGGFSAAAAAVDPTSNSAVKTEVSAAVQQLIQDQGGGPQLVWSPIGSGKTLTQKDKVGRTASA